MKSLFFNLVLILSFLSQSSYQQDISILSWNVDNLFYPENDSLTTDDEICTMGKKAWVYSRYFRKINQVWKTIYSLEPSDLPEIIGLCEVESREVMEDIFLHSPLRKFNYQIFHVDSRDLRGIDCSLAWNGDFFDSVRVVTMDPFSEYPDIRPGRDILYAVFYFKEERLHLFLNHWPSKYGGIAVTDELRMLCAAFLREKTVEILKAETNARIVCCGDFNDSFESGSVQLLMGNNSRDFRLIHPLNGLGTDGSIRYNGRWELIDHFFVSGSLENKAAFCIVSKPWLLEKDEVYGGEKPFRTYTGYRYQGGISDHLPVLLRLNSGK